jgi:E3 ubiquitin-protein ligase SHPRH
MASVLDTGISSAILYTAKPKQEPIAENLEAFSAFFEDCRNAFHSEYSRRPRKRIKLEGTDCSTTSSSLPTSEIAIARFEVNLRPSPDMAKNYDMTTDLDHDIEVGLVKAWDLTSTQPSISLVGHAGYKKSPSLTVKTTSSLSPAMSSLLSRIVCLEKRSRGNAKKGVCRSSCRLHRISTSSGPVYTLECTIIWLDGESAFGPNATKKEDWATLLQFYPEPPNDTQSKSWTPQEFYSSVHSPPIDTPIPDMVDQKVLETDLYPFQKRAVAWMLDRESPSRNTAQSRISYTPAKDCNGQQCFVSHLEGVICSTTHLDTLQEPKGGILAEEMGLGKTCELIALICLNKRKLPALDTNGLETTLTLSASRATLIVTPPTILQQWKDELARHAPGLSVLHYKGVSDIESSKKASRSILQDFAQRDVVITTYSVLAKEIHFAVDPVERSLRRRERKYERPRSPLVQTHWWRVCLDEAQMVESGVSAAAQVASLLPREHAWAVSGTPLKKDVQDLFGLLVFLRYPPFCTSSAIWKRLIAHYGGLFKSLFGQITLRHTKDQVRHELRLPPQRRLVLTLPFTQIEEQNYKTLFETMCEECGCNPDGSPLTDDWDPESSALLQNMRAWLCRLRQTCLHPQVGGRNRKALGRGQGPLRTVAEVLEVMIEQNEASIRTESRLAITTELLRGHIIGNAKDDDHRAEKALEIYMSALRKSEVMVSECRADLARVGADENTSENPHDDSEDETSPEQASKGRYRLALHSALQLHHACAFFVGTTYFQIKSNTEITDPDSDRFREMEEQEMQYYDAAKLVRKELLRENAAKAEKLMRSIKQGKDDVILTPSRLADMESPGGVENVKLVSIGTKYV